MVFLVAILVVTVAIVSCEVTQMMELTPAKSTPMCDVSLWCQDLETAERCDKVSYCTQWIWPQEPHDAVSAVTCENCTEAVDLLLKHNRTIVDFLCGSLPIVAGVCESLVEELISNLTASKVCIELHFCEKTHVPLSPPSDGFCVPCEEVLELFLEHTSTEKRIGEALCHHTSLQLMCEEAVTLLIHFLSTQNATKLCQDMQTCHNPAQLILGADMCTRGPAYWCASLDNAKECGTFDLCKEKYWV